MLCQKGFLGSTPLALPSKVSLTLCKASLLWLGLSAGQLLCPGCDLIKACCCQWPVVASTRDGHHHRPPPPILSSKPLFVPSPSIVSCHPHPAIFTSHLNSSSQTFVPTTVGNKITKKENRLLATSQRGRRGGNLKVIWNCGLSSKLHFQIRPGLKLVELRVLARWEESLLLPNTKRS